MPLFMDRHDLSESVTAEHVAEIHKEDLKIEHKFGCKGLTYWFDKNRKTAFCLIEAPNKKALQEMHNNAHGAIANSIIEVDPTIVESFLGRIEDPDKAQNKELNIINDPAYRILMVYGIENISLLTSDSNREALRDHNNFIVEQFNQFNGRLVKNKSNCQLVSFKSISDAVLCAIEIQSHFKSLRVKNNFQNLRLKLGLCSGIPVTEKDGIFEDTISLARRMCDIANGVVVASSEVQDLYEIESNNNHIDRKIIKIISPSQEKFLTYLMDFTEKYWNKTDLKVEDFSAYLGLSKSQFYRKIKSLTGKSLNTFIRDYRMQRAIDLLKKHAGNISEIAYETGFNSPAYFSKCFLDTYGELPSAFVKRAC